MHTWLNYPWTCMCLVKIRNNQTPKGVYPPVLTRAVQHLGRNLERLCDLRLTHRTRPGEIGEIDTAASVPRHRSGGGRVAPTSAVNDAQPWASRAPRLHNVPTRPQAGGRAESTAVDRIGTPRCHSGCRPSIRSMCTPRLLGVIHNAGAASTVFAAGFPPDPDSHPQPRARLF